MKITPIMKVGIESMTYRAADNFITAYAQSGGTWTWKKDPGLWVLKSTSCASAGLVAVHNTTNFSDGTYSLDAISYGIAVLIYNKLCWSAHNQGKLESSKMWAEQQYKVRDYFLNNCKDEDRVAKFLQFID